MYDGGVQCVARCDSDARPTILRASIGAAISVDDEVRSFTVDVVSPVVSRRVADGDFVGHRAAPPGDELFWRKGRAADVGEDIRPRFSAVVTPIFLLQPVRAVGEGK